MRRFLPIVLVAAAGSLAVNGALAQRRDDDPTPAFSREDGDLLPPEEWNCGIYVDEYREFLKAGNAPEAWRFYGKRYKSENTGEVYGWAQWLQWENSARCGSGAYLDQSSGPGGQQSGPGGGSFDGMTAVGIVAGLLTVGAIANGGGGDKGNSKSPG